MAANALDPRSHTPKPPQLISAGGPSDDPEIPSHPGVDLIHGAPGNDAIEGDEGGDFIYGEAGDDRIDGWTGNDTIYGDDGNDEIYGWAGNDSVYGGGGHDNLFGEAGEDWLFGQQGDDFIDGGPGLDHIEDSFGTNFVADPEFWAPDPPPVWPDDLPWPELNLVADVTADVILDDDGPGCNQTETYQGPPYPPNDPLARGYWFTEENSQAFGGLQTYLYADEDPQPPPGDPPADGLGDGDNASVWYAPVWTEKGKVYVSWVPRSDAATNAPFYVTTKDGVELGDSPFELNQTLWPDQQTLPGAIIDGRKYTLLGEFDVTDGWLLVSVTDKGVLLGQSIVADVVLVDPVYDPENPVEHRPGSWANREENGFYGGLLLEMQDANATWTKVQLRVEDPNNQLAGKTLQLYFEGDGTVVEVYSDPEMTQRVYSGDTWDIGQMSYIWVKGVGAGSTELVLTLEDPIVGQRPLSDILAVNVNQ